MSRVEPWELLPYQGAAMRMCSRLGVDPFVTRSDANGQPAPAWTEFALRMHEHRVMLECLFEFGMLPPPA